ncbi:MAG: Na(+)/H(+) antiporter subunit [Naasia sp.]|nr:Na(+)/H(+) antiporter subunit [Naasia sp.]
MTVSLALLVPMAVLYASGVYLLLEKSMTRVILGILLIGNATNLLLLMMSGPAGVAPIADGKEPGAFSDPVPQALILTAIVITFAVSAFLLALVYRSWRLAQEDEVQVDEEDVAVATRDTQAAEEPDRGEESSEVSAPAEDPNAPPPAEDPNAPPPAEDVFADEESGDAAELPGVDGVEESTGDTEGGR